MAHDKKNDAELAAILAREYSEFKQKFPELNFADEGDIHARVGAVLAQEMARQAGNFLPVIAESKRPYLGKLLTLTKKIIWRLWRPFAHIYLRPQNEFNQLTVSLAYRLASLEARLNEVELSMQNGSAKN